MDVGDFLRASRTIAIITHVTLGTVGPSRFRFRPSDADFPINDPKGRVLVAGNFDERNTSFPRPG